MTSHMLTSHANNLHARAATASRRLAIAMAAHLIGLAVMPAHAAEVASYEVVAKEGRLFPEVLNVPAGVKLRLTLRNEGKTAIEFENLVLRVEKIVAPDSAATVTVQPLKPGSYVFVDDFHTETAKMQVVAK
jgi:hypothetical protein